MKFILFLLFFLTMFSLVYAQETNSNISGSNVLNLNDIVDMVLGNDVILRVSKENLNYYQNTYNRIRADAYPKLLFDSSYGIDFWSKQEIDDDIILNKRLNQSLYTSVSLSQLLPTYGTIAFEIENIMTIASANSYTYNSSTVDVDDVSISHEPSISIIWKQPVLLNNKFIDTELYDSTFRKYKLNYLNALQEDLIIKNSTIYTAMKLVFNAYNIKKTIIAYEKSIELKNMYLKKMEQNLELGIIQETDVWELKIEIGEERELLLNSQYDLLQVEGALRDSLGIPDEEEIIFDNNLLDIQIQEEEIEITDELLNNNPEIKQLEFELEGNRIERIINGYEYASTLTTAFSISPIYSPDRSIYEPHDFASSFSDFRNEDAGSAFSFSIGLSVPLYTGKMKTHSKNADIASVDKVYEELVLQKQSLILVLETQLLKKEKIKQNIFLLQDNVLLIETRLGIMEKLLDAGKKTESDLIEVEIDLLVKQNELRKAKADLILIYMNIYIITGKELSEIFN